mmetsp:Transcript_16067/g.29038  ORF Transcript_16067/g.29038 Transcript_16067/m.29038 type:complete len:200 (+) Transcript_16067:1420-2019(+)
MRRNGISTRLLDDNTPLGTCSRINMIKTRRQGNEQTDRFWQFLNLFSWHFMKNIHDDNGRVFLFLLFQNKVRRVDKGHGWFARHVQLNRLSCMNDGPLEDSTINLYKTFLDFLTVIHQEHTRHVGNVRMRMLENIIDLLQHELKTNAHVSRQVDKLHLLPSSTSADLNIFGGSQPVVQHIAFGKLLLFLLSQVHFISRH